MPGVLRTRPGRKADAAWTQPAPERWAGAVLCAPWLWASGPELGGSSVLLLMLPSVWSTARGFPPPPRPSPCRVPGGICGVEAEGGRWPCPCFPSQIMKKDLDWTLTFFLFLNSQQNLRSVPLLIYSPNGCSAWGRASRRSHELGTASRSPAWAVRPQPLGFILCSLPRRVSREPHGPRSSRDASWCQEEFAGPWTLKCETC